MISLLSWVLGQCSPERRQRKCHYGAEMQAVLQGELHWYVLRNLRDIIHFTLFLLSLFFSPHFCLTLFVKSIHQEFFSLYTGAWVHNRYILVIMLMKETARPLGEFRFLHEQDSYPWCHFTKACTFFCIVRVTKWCNVNFSGEVRRIEFYLLRANCRNCLVTLFL